MTNHRPAAPLPWIGAALVALGLGATVFLGRTVPGGALAPLGLVPIVVGAAFLLVGASRAVDAGALRRRPRLVLGGLATAVGLVTVIAAVLVVAPVVTGGAGQTLAVGLQHVDGPTTPDSTTPPSAAPDSAAPDTDPTTPPDPSSVAVDAVLEQGTALQADCEVAMAGRTDPAHCWAWSLTAPAACEAQVTVRFGPDPDAPATRTEERFVSLSPGVPLSLVLRGGETIAGLDHPTCVSAGAAPYPIGTYDAGVDLPDSDFPAACDDWGCDGFIFDAESGCDQATIEVHVFDAVADQHSRDYVVVQPLTDGTSTTHNEVFVPYDHGRQPADAEVSSVTCED